MAMRESHRAFLKRVRRAQDKRFPSKEMYVVVFFPRVIGLKTEIYPHTMIETCAPTARQARQLFMGRTLSKWRSLHHAGWNVRKIRIVDLGPAA